MPENIAYEPSRNNLTTNSGLLPHYLQQLTEASSLNREMIVESGYRSVTIRMELSELLPDGLSHQEAY
jgi:hypothetical protein